MKETRFKDTEIGRIPEDWEVVYISDIANNYTGLTYTPDSIREHGTLVLRSSNIKDGKICYDDNVFVEMSVPERATVKNNDILVCVRNGSARLIGKCAMIEGIKSETAFGAFMTILRSKGQVNPHFLFYGWQSMPIQQQIQDNLGATINQITNKDINNFILATPPSYREQVRIASALTSIDNLISSLDKLIEKKKAIKEGTMQQLLTGKKRMKGFNEPWVEKELGKIGDTYSGLTGKTKDDFGVGNAHYITFLNILNNPVLDTSIFEKVRVVENEKQNDALKGDLFFNTSSETPEEVGICSMLDDDIPSLFLNSFCFGYRLSDKQISPKYLVYYFRCSKGRKLMTLLAQGVTRYNMSKTAFNTAKIVIPSCLDEQIKIVHILTCMDLEIQSLEAKRDKYIKTKQGMMQQLLTGRIRLV